MKWKVEICSAWIKIVTVQHMLDSFSFVTAAVCVICGEMDKEHEKG